MSHTNENDWKEAISLYENQKDEKQAELKQFEENLNNANHGFLNENGAQITLVDPYAPRFGSVDFIVDIPDEEKFIKKLIDKKEPAVYLGQANDGKLNTTSSFPTPSGPNPCGWTHGGKVENTVDFRPYELQKLVTSACAHIPNGGLSAYTSGNLYFNIGSFTKDTNIHVIFQYLWKYYYQWDFTPKGRFSDAPKLSLKIDLLKVQNGKVIGVDYGSNIEQFEILRNAPNMPITGIKTISPKLKRKAEMFYVKAGQGHHYVVNLSTYNYTWPNNGSTFAKNDFQLVPYS